MWSFQPFLLLCWPFKQLKGGKLLLSTQCSPSWTPLAATTCLDLRDTRQTFSWQTSIQAQSWRYFSFSILIFSCYCCCSCCRASLLLDPKFFVWRCWSQLSLTLPCATTRRLWWAQPTRKAAKKLVARGEEARHRHQVLRVLTWTSSVLRLEFFPTMAQWHTRIPSTRSRKTRQTQSWSFLTRLLKDAFTLLTNTQKLSSR